MRKRLFVWLSVLLCITGLVMAQPTVGVASKVNIQILATSDVHGWFVPWDFATDTKDTKGSLTYLATLIDKHRAENPNVILVDAGDSVQANHVEYFIDHKENPMIVAMNQLGYDVWTWGNHEYNFDYKRRAHLIEQANATILSGNVHMKSTGERYLPAWTIIEREGVRIGIIGVTTPLIASFEEGKGTLDEVTVVNPLDEVATAIEELQKKHVDAIVGVMHMGLDEENNVKGSSITDIAEAFPEFAVIIGGHAHVNVESKTVNGVLLTEPYYYARVLGVVDLSFENTDSGWKIVSKSSRNEPCGSVEQPALVKTMEPFKAELRSYVNTPIGKLINADLCGHDEVKGISSVYTKGTGIINLLGHAGMYYTGAQCTVLCTDYEDAGFPIGPISIKDISSAYSFSAGEITVYEMTGKQLKQLLEWSAGYFNTMKEGDLTISYNPERRASKYSSDFTGCGITYTVDLTKEQGNRIKDLALITEYHKDGTPVLKDGKPVTMPIADDMVIKVGTNDYYMKQWRGKGGCLEGASFKIDFSSSDAWGDDGSVRAMTVRYIKEVLGGVVDGSAFAYENWHCETGVDQNSSAYRKAVELINSGQLKLPVSDKGRTNVAPITIKDVEPFL